MSHWYRRDGSPYKINKMEFMKNPSEWKRGMDEVEEDLKKIEKRRVALTRLWWGGVVSTVWMGLDYSFDTGVHDPLIFESMVFPQLLARRREVECRRYSSEEQALAGHLELVKIWSSPRGIIRLLSFWKNSVRWGYIKLRYRFNRFVKEDGFDYLILGLIIILGAILIFRLFFIR